MKQILCVGYRRNGISMITARKENMRNLQGYWKLSPTEQETIREEAQVETDEEHQAFLNALFPAGNDETYDLSDTNHTELPA